MNPIGISVLYVASDAKTCIKELHPGVEELISVATIETTKELKVADLSKGNSRLDNAQASYLSIYVQELISQGYKERDYIFPQFVSSYCKSLGFDGIGYRSRYATREQINKKSGINYTFFNYRDRFKVTSSKQALIRECREELAITVAVEGVFTEVTHVYPDLMIHLTLFNARIAEGTPQKLEHNDIRWITPAEIGNYEFCPADEEILGRIREKFA